MSISVATPEDVRAIVREELERALRVMQKATPVPDESRGMSPDDILTVPEAANLAKLQPDTIREWIKAGRLRAGNRPYRIRRGDLMAALAEKKPREPGEGRVDEVVERLARRTLGRIRNR